MKVKEVRVTIREKLNVGNYETIEPEVTMIGTLEPNDDPVACASELHKMAQPAWAKQALIELAWVAQRRRSDTNKLHEYMEMTKDSRAQIKTLM